MKKFLFLLTALTTATMSLAGTVNFEKQTVGEFKTAKLVCGTLTTAGKARFMKQTSGNCLHIFGGKKNTVELTFDAPAKKDTAIEFRAERWTVRSPFVFVIEAKTAKGFKTIYDGTKTVKVGRGFPSTVQCELPEGTQTIRFVVTAPATAGLLIDDLKITKPSPMEIQSITASQIVRGVYHNMPANGVVAVTIAAEGGLKPVSLTSMAFRLSGTCPVAQIKTVELYAGKAGVFDPRNPGEKLGEAMASEDLKFDLNRKLVSGNNTLWLSVTLKAGAPMRSTIQADCIAAKIGGKDYADIVNPTAKPQRVSYCVAWHGDGESKEFRIPGIVRSNKGTLIAVFDKRYDRRGDLPGNVDVGVCRSEDGGQTWDRVKVAMDCGNDPKFRYDGVGDPAILVDRKTGRIWIAAIWSHGNRAWRGSGPGFTPAETGQFMLNYSDDDGKTWSKNINITKQVKQRDWCYLLQGPGMGITLRDGTLVFPAQYQDTLKNRRVPHSTIIYSKDRGKTWQCGTGAKPNTTESQVVELNDGSLMLNMRDNRGGSRSVYTSKDLGKTWVAHETSRKALIEPVCMASLIRFESTKDGKKRNVLLFSNPDRTRGRADMTIKASLDEGKTWTAKTLYYNPGCCGYSCLVKIDDNHVGVLFEGAGTILFQSFHIDEILNNKIEKGTTPVASATGRPCCGL